ncbi:phospholipase D-like domain-containing anti-phage protein [Thiocystis violacea]|uniref:phospholipase D-like domain-containing anti-phage protein n=1 Tax=Thiocystis violacea TaxID=13725 RepID=UPI0019073128|nr:phospholipase D-like domain-containing anti-phage protein [Thiocystis violacea]MBK1725031.1 helicase [Thiocystis violacea]
MTIRRFSSRTRPLDQSFLAEHLQGARSYRRIAGYFTSSLFEIAHEWLEPIPDVRIVCNVDLTPEDLKVAQLRESRLLGRWNERSIEAESLLNRERYRRLDAFLAQRGQVIRVAPDSLCGFLHGKAGVIERADGRKLGFIGSMNETRHGWQSHYEILWEDDSPEGVAWIEAEFEFLWNAARPLPEAVCREVRRRGQRFEVTLPDLESEETLAPAALIESPLYREGMALQPWQQGFVAECLRHYDDHGQVRLLLADEVGLGKTLSLGTAALTLCLLAEKTRRRRKPIAIFAPATLCEQWQTEMIDKLGIPCGRWHSSRKVWLDPEARAISPAGPEQIARCPLRIGIVSTGLMVQPSQEKAILSGLSFELVVLDEAHKARTRQGYGGDVGEPNGLLTFMLTVANRADHVLLGTATPIQTHAEDLWDLVRVLHRGSSGFVLGNELAPWHQPARVLPILNGAEQVENLDFGWRLLRSPLPTMESTNEPNARRLFRNLREDLGLGRKEHLAGALTDLPPDLRDDLETELERVIDGARFFQRENPLVRHVVLRKRSTLEGRGLLDKIAVNVHPDAGLVRDPHRFNALFQDIALRTPPDFDRAYEEARAFGRVLARRGKGGGFMKNLMEQRVCSSIVAGLNTATALLEGREVHEETEDQDLELMLQTDAERAALEALIAALDGMRGDPKLDAVRYYLKEEGWLELGCIIFSQYYDTARWVADALAEDDPAETIGLYAGADRSRLYRDGQAVGIVREELKRMVADHDIRIMVATDAACEGLNLQTLGTLINIDLPWNPTRLEQRIGRIKRFGQARSTVDMLNLVHQGTVDETVYQRLSERMRNRYDLFGGLPDTIRDDWIDDLETLGEQMDRYIEERRQATGFDLRYNDSLEPSANAWRDCATVLARRDLENLMRMGWGGP